MENQLDLRQVNYRNQNLQKVALNAGELRDQLNARDKNAFDNVANRCGDLEQVCPGSGQELRRKAQEQKMKYQKTHDPACFTQLITDLEELYSRAFKLMLENFKREKEKENRKLDRENAILSNGYDVMGPAPNDLSNVKARPEPAPAPSPRGKGKLGKTPKVSSVSIAEVDATKNAMSNGSNTISVNNSEDDRLRRYNERVAEKAEANANQSSASSYSQSAPQMGRSKSKY